MNYKNLDIHQHITDQIIKVIEAGVGQFQLPWHRSCDNIIRPINVGSQKPYHGVNILSLWAASDALGYSTGLWGTFKQWQAVGAKVRKGERASYVTFYKQLMIYENNDENQNPHIIAWATPVFSAEQEDGYNLSAHQLSESAQNIDINIEQFIANTGALIYHGHNDAYYRSSTDSIHLPKRERFLASETSSATESYYSTLFHELVHWTSPSQRCNRDLSGRFGSTAYAMEELVAELGAAFLCVHFDISSVPRKDHAQYLSGWLSVLKSDKRAIFTAASKASKAVSFLQSYSGES